MAFKSAKNALQHLARHEADHGELPSASAFCCNGWTTIKVPGEQPLRKVRADAMLMVLDVSGSMMHVSTPMLEASQETYMDIQNLGIEVRLVCFSHNAYMVNDAIMEPDGVRRVMGSDFHGGTDFDSMLRLVRQNLPHTSDPDRTKLLFVTDGSSHVSWGLVQDLAKKVEIHSVAYGTHTDDSTLKRIGTRFSKVLDKSGLLAILYDFIGQQVEMEQLRAELHTDMGSVSVPVAYADGMLQGSIRLTLEAGSQVRVTMHGTTYATTIVPAQMVSPCDIVLNLDSILDSNTSFTEHREDVEALLRTLSCMDLSPRLKLIVEKIQHVLDKGTTETSLVALRALMHSHFVGANAGSKRNQRNAVNMLGFMQGIENGERVVQSLRQIQFPEIEYLTEDALCLQSTSRFLPMLLLHDTRPWDESIESPEGSRLFNEKINTLAPSSNRPLRPLFRPGFVYSGNLHEQNMTEQDQQRLYDSIVREGTMPVPCLPPKLRESDEFAEMAWPLIASKGLLMFSTAPNQVGLKTTLAWSLAPYASHLATNDSDRQFEWNVMRKYWAAAVRSVLPGLPRFVHRHSGATNIFHLSMVHTFACKELSEGNQPLEHFEYVSALPREELLQETFLKLDRPIQYVAALSLLPEVPSDTVYALVAESLRCDISHRLRNGDSRYSKTVMMNLIDELHDSSGRKYMDAHASCEVVWEEEVVDAALQAKSSQALTDLLSTLIRVKWGFDEILPDTCDLNSYFSSSAFTLDQCRQIVANLQRQTTIDAGFEPNMPVADPLAIDNRRAILIMITTAALAGTRIKKEYAGLKDMADDDLIPTPFDVKRVLDDAKRHLAELTARRAIEGDLSNLPLVKSAYDSYLGMDLWTWALELALDQNATMQFVCSSLPSKIFVDTRVLDILHRANKREEFDTTMELMKCKNPVGLLAGPTCNRAVCSVLDRLLLEPTSVTTGSSKLQNRMQWSHYDVDFGQVATLLYDQSTSGSVQLLSKLGNQQTSATFFFFSKTFFRRPRYDLRGEEQRRRHRTTHRNQVRSVSSGGTSDSAREELLVEVRPVWIFGRHCRAQAPDRCIAQALAVLPKVNHDLIKLLISSS